MNFEDSFKYQFSFYSYLAKINSDIIIFIENNNYDFNFVCFAKFKKDGKRYVLTTDIKRRVDNGYRVITIENMECGENRVVDGIIEYEGWKIIITEKNVNFNDYEISVRVPKIYGVLRVNQYINVDAI
jgi:hypothetical protein